VSTIDFEREGLLDGTSGEERAARLELVRHLATEGVSLAELRRAVDEDRLALLPVELVFAGDARYTIGDAAERTGLDQGFLARNRLALGLARPGPKDLAFSEEDIEGLRAVKQLLDAGLPEDDMLALARVVGQGSARTADAVLGLLGQLLLRVDDTERDLGLRYAEAARGLAPLMAPALVSPLRLHIEDIIRGQVIGRAERASGSLPGTRDVAVCFADLVGFTLLGERSGVSEIGDVTGRLETLAAEAANPPVRLVKTIGDAAMLASTDPAALLSATLDLVAAATSEGQGFPQLRAGVAYGPALPRSGDWYGRPVNLASRITAVADPGCVLASIEVREAVGDGYEWTREQPRTFKGIEGSIHLFRVRGPG
jgi:adenylate cyclase